MARAKVVEFDYYQFVQLLRRATDGGKRLDRADPGWSDYVREHGINEVAATAIARQKFESAVPVIIAEGLESDGLYFHSKNEEACLRLVTI